MLGGKLGEPKGPVSSTEAYSTLQVIAAVDSLIEVHIKERRATAVDRKFGGGRYFRITKHMFATVVLSASGTHYMVPVVPGKNNNHVCFLWHAHYSEEVPAAHGHHAHTR